MKSSHFYRLAALFLPVLVIACSDNAGEAAEKASDLAVAAQPRELIIKARDYAFDAPDTVEAGVTNIRLQNAGPEMHHVALIKFEQGKTLADLNALMAAGAHSLPDWAVEVGGPNAPNGPAESAALLDLAPGNYVLVCFIPSPDGMPHLMKGMVKELTVVPAATPSATLPSANIVMTLHDYTFTESAPLTAGRHTIRVENQAEQAHEVLIVKLEAGKKAEDVIAWIEKPNGPPPAAIVGGITGIDKGQVNLINVEMSAGEYALLCFLPDAKDGKPHFVHGMVKHFTVS
jgi:hypothetical protein